METFQPLQQHCKYDQQEELSSYNYSWKVGQKFTFIFHIENLRIKPLPTHFMMVKYFYYLLKSLIADMLSITTIFM